MEGTEKGTVRTPIRVTGDYTLMGMATETITVTTTGVLHLMGMANKDVLIEAGGLADIDGTVNGNVHNAGTVRVSGIVKGHVTSTGDATEVIEPGSYIGGVKQ